MAVTHQHWSSRIGFLLAAIGAAVGLGSVWKFPYTVGASGGGAFVIVYLIASALITLPILVGELMLGRRGQASPPHAMGKVAREIGQSPLWSWLGWLSVTAIYLILTFYCVIGGWVLAYIVKAVSGDFVGQTAAGIEGQFDALLASPFEMSLWHGLFVFLNTLIIIRGVREGIERVVKTVMPALFLMLLVLVVYGCVVGDVRTAVAFLFTPNFAAIDARTVLSAVGLSFFSIGTGMALMMTYGSYLDRQANLPRSALTIAASVPIAALATGLAVFSLVFANGLNPGEGPGLLFVTLPLAFSQMTGGVIFGTIFFVLVLLATLTSSIAGIEPIVAWGEEHRGINRRTSTIVASVVAWVLGLGTVFSFNLWADFHPLAGLGKYDGMTIFDLIDFLTSNIMLPLANILICVFVGWLVPRAILVQEVGGNGLLFTCWRWALRILAPLAIAALLIVGV